MNRRIRLILAAIVGLLSILAADQLYLRERRQEQTYQMELARQGLEQELATAIQLRLAAVLDLRGFMLAGPTLPDSATFDKYAASLLEVHPVMRAVQFADSDRIIRYVYPLEGNEPALNLDLTGETAAPFVEKAISERRLVVQDPTILVQGSLSIVARVPLYVDDELLGVAQGVIDVASILDDVGTHYRNDFVLQLFDQHGIQFWGPASKQPEALTAEIPVGDSYWTLRFERKSGPSGPGRFMRALIWFSGVVLVGSTLLLVNQYFTRTEWLRSAVEEKTTALRLETERSQRYLDTANVMLLALDQRGAITMINRTGCEMLGFVESEIVGKNWFEFFLPVQNQTRIRHVFDQIIAGEIESLTYFENEVLTNYGYRKTVGWNNAPIRNQEGAIIGILSSGVDITQRKAAEIALKQSEAQYRMLFEDAPIAMLVVNLQPLRAASQRLEGIGLEDMANRLRSNMFDAPSDSGGFEVLDANPATYTLFEADSEQELRIVLSGLGSNWKPEDRLKILAAISSGVLEQELEIVEKTARQKEIHLLLKWAVQPGYEETYENVLVSLIDISRIKETEDALQHYNDRLTVLREIDEAVLTGGSINGIVATALQGLRRLSGISHLTVILLSDDGLELDILTADEHRSLRKPVQELASAVDEASVRMLTEGRHVHLPNLTGDGLPPDAWRIVRHDDSRAITLVPMLDLGKLTGTITAATHSGNPILEWRLELVKEVATQLAIAISRVRLRLSEESQRVFSEALRENAVALNRARNLDTVLDAIMESLASLGAHDGSAILLLGGDTDQQLVRSEGRVDLSYLLWQKATAPGIPADGSVKGLLIVGEPIIIDDFTTFNGKLKPRSLSGLVASVITAPIRLNDNTVGYLNVFSRQKGRFKESDARKLKGIAEQAAAGMEKVQLIAALESHTENLEQLVLARTDELQAQYRLSAIQEERQRLARDLHDAVSQKLFSANVIAETLPLMQLKTPEKVSDGLEQLQKLTRGALAEMRRLLLELRPEAILGARLHDLLRQSADALMAQSNARVTVSLDESIELTTRDHITFYRIAQEAMTNVSRHANADTASVVLERGSDNVRLTVRDDGCGFDHEMVSKDHLGLKIMEERAKQIDADLCIESKLGSGTEISLTKVWQHE